MRMKKLAGMLWSGVLQFSWGKVAVGLVVILASLQVLHLVLLSRLENRNSALKQEQLMFNLRKESEKLYTVMKKATEDSQIVDSSGEYQIVRELYSLSHLTASPTDTVTLVTQCSVDNLYHLVEMIERWKGPISVTVFTPGRHLVIAIQAVLLLYQCLPAFRENVTVHVVYPLVHSPSQIPPSLPTSSPECTDLRTMLKAILTSDHNYAISGVKYPNNLLRNTALFHVYTDYVMVVDIDILPSYDLHQTFTEFLHKYDQVLDNTVYIVPTFEVLSHITPPKNKKDLLYLYKQGSIRPFYNELCWRCQRQTDYMTWLNLTLTPDLKVAYEVEWKDPWEPFYIGPNSIPRYDERFKQYGFNRISQVCELHVGGYKFAVLDNAFLVHQGFKKPEDFHLTKDIEQEKNRLLFRQFKEELKVKYSESTKRCY